MIGTPAQIAPSLRSGQVARCTCGDYLLGAAEAVDADPQCPSKRERFTDLDDLVFPAWDGGTQYHGDVRIRFYAALRAAKLKRIRFHDLRHAFGTLAAQKFPLASVQTMMGTRTSTGP